MTKTKLEKTGEALMALDRKVQQAALPVQNRLPVRILSVISEVGDQPPMLAISGGVAIAGAWRGDARMIRAGGRMLAAHLLATGLKNMIKRRVDRTRPFAADGAEDHKPEPGTTDSKEETSFPSGHTAGAMAVAQAFAREYPDHAGKALGGAGLIALAQVPRCAHYPTDVGAGLVIGWLSELAVDRAARTAIGLLRA